MSEAPTVEGRLADMIERSTYLELGLDGDRAMVLGPDRGVIVAALRDRARWMSSDTSSGERRKRA